MRAFTYSMLGLLVLSLVFPAGASFSQDIWYQEEATSYNMPAKSGWDVFMASTMLWNQARNPEGLYVAEIKDLIIDPASGRVTDVVFTTIERLGAAEVYVPFDTISKSGDAVFVYHAPEDVYRFYGEAPYWSEGFYLYADRPLKAGYRASELIGATAKGSGGEDLGWFDDVVIDPRGGHIAYFIVSGVGGDEWKSVAVPPTGFSRTEEGSFALNVNLDTLAKAPAFSYPELKSERYAGDLYRYYGLAPYWE